MREKIEVFMVLSASSLELSFTLRPKCFIHMLCQSAQRPWPANSNQRSVARMEERTYARKHLSQPVERNLHKDFHLKKGTLACYML